MVDALRELGGVLTMLALPVVITWVWYIIPVGRKRKREILRRLLK